MFIQKRQRGQSLILIGVALVALLAITALAIDSGNAFSDRRHAQTAADNAALAAALEKVSASDWQTIAVDRAASNGYANDAEHTVAVYRMADALADPTAGCSALTNPVNTADHFDTLDNYILVTIHTTVDTFFGQVIGIRQVRNCVQAIARSQPFLMVPPFGGAAVVGLDPIPGENGFDSGQSNAAHWKIRGGGVFSNSNAHSKNAASVTFPGGDCVTSVGTSSGFDCPTSERRTDLFYNYPADVLPLLPPTPPCTGTAAKGADGKWHEQSGQEGKGSTVASFQGDYAPGLYCITNAGGNIHSGITGTGVTFYITDTSFTMKFNGGGYLGASAPTDPNDPLMGAYAGVLMFAPVVNPPCSQNIDIRGNGSTPITGSIIMPSACIDYRGNGTGYTTNSQIIGYQISSNGNADLNIGYQPDDNYKVKQPPAVELTK